MALVTGWLLRPGDSFLLAAPGGVYPVSLFPGHMHRSAAVTVSTDPARDASVDHT